MNVHEYQAKGVLGGYGVPVSRGVAIFSAGEAEAAARELGGPVWVVKSQIHAGGRGKGTFKGAAPDAKGGVRVVRSVLRRSEGPVGPNAAWGPGRSG